MHGPHPNCWKVLSCQDFEQNGAAVGHLKECLIEKVVYDSN